MYAPRRSKQPVQTTLMLSLAMLGAGWLLLNRLDSGTLDMVTGRENLERMSNPSVTSGRPPMLFRDEISEKSFAANQPRGNVIAPYGPNPQTARIDAFDLINWPQYRARYQQEIHRLTVQNQDWRLDPSFNSCLNNFSNPHMPEDYPPKILMSAATLLPPTDDPATKR